MEGPNVKEYMLNVVTIKALQYTGDNENEVADFLGVKITKRYDDSLAVSEMQINTRTINMYDYVFKHPDGRYVILSPTTFERSYTQCCYEDVLDNTSIKGHLSIRDKIWFNDNERCRLRICGFDLGDIEAMEKRGLVDITMVPIPDDPHFQYKAIVNISRG